MDYWKLIELLNEYIEKNIETPNRCIGYSCSYFGFDGGADVIEDTIISKRYGFIKWLVENEKIDFQIWKGEKYLEHPIGSDNFDGVYDYKDIIQRLSISDTPIEDLISYLK